MKSLYETLGVARTATAAEIKSAHRRGAKASHPDHHPERAAEFRAIQHAAEVLLDPARRARYDETGAHEDATPEDAMVMEALVAAYEKALRSDSKQDIITRTRSILRLAIHDLAKQGEILRENLQTLRAVLDRLQEPPGRAILGPITEGMIEEQAEQAARIETQMNLCQKALGLIAGAKFATDPADLFAGYTA